MGNNRIVAVTHGYPPRWNMGGEVALHRLLMSTPDVERVVLTYAPEPYELEGIRVEQVDAPTTFADPNIRSEDLANKLLWEYTDSIKAQLSKHEPDLVIVQNELSLVTVNACKQLGIPSLVSVHTPPRYGSGIRQAVLEANYRLFNTVTSARQWGFPTALVVHPMMAELPEKPDQLPEGKHYTLLSSLGHKGVGVLAKVAQKMPTQPFIVVRSPASSMENLEVLQGLTNVRVAPRVDPDEVALYYYSDTRVLLVPSRYETYGMSAIEAAGYGIPSVHVDTPHVREGIGFGAELVPALNHEATYQAILTIEQRYSEYSVKARARAEELWHRQSLELDEWAGFLTSVING